VFCVFPAPGINPRFQPASVQVRDVSGLSDFGTVTANIAAGYGCPDSAYTVTTYRSGIQIIGGGAVQVCNPYGICTTVTNIGPSAPVHTYIHRADSPFFIIVNGELPSLVAGGAVSAAPRRLVVLTVGRSGNGSGTVTGEKGTAGIECGQACSKSYVRGTTVNLSSTADPGSTFVGWGGACGDAGVYPCTLKMTSDQLVTATFSSLPDLTFSQVTPNSFTISNTGPASAGPFLVQVGSDVSAYSFPGLAAHVSVTQPLDCVVTDRFATIDPNNRIQEGNEGNNSAVIPGNSDCPAVRPP
jgi:Divergent InlB B-repeat domain